MSTAVPAAAGSLPKLRQTLRDRREQLKTQRTNQRALIRHGAVPELDSVKTKKDERVYMKNIIPVHGVRPLLQQLNIQDAEIEQKANDAVKSGTVHRLSTLTNMISEWMAEKSKVADETLLQAREQSASVHATGSTEAEQPDPLANVLQQEAVRRATLTHLPSAYSVQALRQALASSS